MASHSSEVWKYFQKLPNESSQCLLCNKNYSRKGRGTTSLRNHLQSMHKNEFQELMSGERKKSEEILKKEKTPLQQVKTDIMHKNVGEYFQRTTTWENSNRKSKDLDNCVAEIVVMDDLLGLFINIPNIRIRGSSCTDIRNCIRIRGSASSDIRMCIRVRGSSCTDIRICIRGSRNFGIRYITSMNSVKRGQKWQLTRFSVSCWSKTLKKIGKCFGGR